MYINVDGLTVHYTAKGAGIPLLLLHGHGESGYTWRYNIDGLAEKFMVYALDLKGFGSSDKPMDGDYSIPAMSELVVRFMDELEIGQAVLVCHSFAGKIGIQTSLTHPMRCKGLGLLDCAVGRFRIWPGFRLMAAKGLGEVLIRMFNRRSMRGIVRNLHDKSYSITEEDIQEYLRLKKSRESRNAFLAYLREFLKDRGALFEQLEEISTPTLIIWGKNDRFIDSEQGVLLHQKMKRSRLEILDHCGHNPQEDQPEEVNQLIIETFGNLS